MYHSLLQDILKNQKENQAEVQSYRAQLERAMPEIGGSAGSGALGASGGPTATLKELPAKVPAAAMKRWMPDIQGCYPFHSPSEGRIRVFYNCGGTRWSRSMATEKLGERKAVIMALKEVWTVHDEATGEQCPWNLAL